MDHTCIAFVLLVWPSL